MPQKPLFDFQLLILNPTRKRCLIFNFELLIYVRDMITYNTDGVLMPKIRRRETTAWIRQVAAYYGRKVGEIGYMFVSDEKILEVNREYLGHDYYTDVITFDYDEGNIVNGDIVISLDTVRTNAVQFGKPYEEELRRVIIHGVLHLCGINDKGPGEREVMEAAENHALSLLKGNEKSKNQALKIK